MEILDAYLAGPGELRKAFDGLTREQLLARPVDGKWSAMEVLCHLVDADLSIALRIRAALRSDRPRMIAATMPEMTAKLGVDARDAEEELTLFETIRSQTARIVGSFPEEALDRDVILIKETGEEVLWSVRKALTIITGHVGHHLTFVAEKRTAMGLG